MLLKWKIERAQFIPKKTVSSQLRNHFATGPKGLLLGLKGACMEHCFLSPKVQQHLCDERRTREMEPKTYPSRLNWRAWFLSDRNNWLSYPGTDSISTEPRASTIGVVFILSHDCLQRLKVPRGWGQGRHEVTSLWTRKQTARGIWQTSDSLLSPLHSV